jgi:hypothetical protein
MGTHTDLSSNITMKYRPQSEDHHIEVKSDKEKKFNNTLNYYLKNDPDVVVRALDKHHVSFNKEYNFANKYGLNVFQFEGVTLLVVSCIVTIAMVLFISNLYILVAAMFIWFSVLIRAYPTFTDEHYKRLSKNMDDFFKE